MYGTAGKNAGDSSAFSLASQLVANATSRWWEKPKEDEPLSVWQVCHDKDGVEYYYNVETRETTWDKPAELMTAAEMDNQGDWVWIPDEQECFVPARVISTTSTHVNVMDQNGRENSLKVKKNTLEPLKRSSLQRVVSDLVLLDIMSAPLILHNLKQRFLKHEIYTNVGTILIAINPYTMLPLYTDEVVRQYARRKLGQEMPPHAFNIAHDSFIGLRDFNQNQSIVISGESGAGKTEATKHCLSYLAFMAGSGSNVAASILRTNPILEAFGNAKTLRNDNSSRFGKFMQLFFQGKHCTMSGCMVKSYLLEKIRVVQQTQQERNFHIFYQLTKGATDEQRSKYRLRDPSLYKYLKTCTSVSTIDDVREFKEVVEAFDELKIGKTEQDNIFSIVSAVASLGDVEFQLDRAKDAAFVSDTGSESPTAIAASLLNIDTNTLAKALVTKELRIRNQPTTVMVLNKQQALAQRDALAKFIYGYLFEWLVSRLNVAVGQPADRSRFIGCLDIFGFEIFEINSFEQLCINFTNEMLQQHFNYQTFKLEEAVYRAENIKFDHIAFIDNQPMLDLIAKKPIGLLAVLDEELIVPKGSDLGFLGKMHNHHENSTVFRNDSKRKNSFIIKHYAGDVSYNVVGFLEKNRDSLTEDMIDVLRTSSHDLVTVLFPRDKEISNQEKKASLGSQFRRQLDELMTTLRLTEPHYIRCIKPNPHKAATAFYPSMCNEQLTYSGVFEAVAIRKAGYPFRLKHEVFSERYRVLFDNERAPGSSSREQCLNIIKHMKLPMENVQMGTTMVLYRADEHKLLELHRSIKVRLAETQADLERLVTTDTSGFSDADKEIFFRELAGAVRSADEFRIKTPASQQARRLIDKYVEERMDPETKTQLEVALKSKNLQQLTAILKICEANGYQTSIVRQCQELLEQVIDAEAALRVAKSELSEDYLQKAIAMCEEFSYDSESVQEARLLLENISRAKEMIRRSMSSRNHEHLRRTIDFCRSFGYETAAVLECEELFDQIMHVRKLCSDATKAVDLGKLKTALREADALEYDVDIVYEARLLYDRLLRIDAEAGKALASVHDLHVRAVLKAANEVGFKTKNTKRLRQILDGRQSDYVQAQLSSASAIGDHGRAILISLSLREERQAEHSHSLQIAKYPKLKDPQTWGEEKFWGSSTYRAQTMLSYNDAYVHAPLTSIFTQLSHPRGKELTEKVLLIYENVQKIMTIRYSQRIPQRTQEVLMYGLENVELRDEVYLAMIKMITNNPNPQSIVLGWDLFGLVVLAFPPSVDFEDYVFSFLALPSNEQSVIERNLKYLLTRSCYLGAVAQPYWRCQDDLQNMRHIFNLHAPRQSNNGLSKTDVTPYEDLKSNYYDEDYEDHVFTAMKLAKIAQRKLDLYFSQSKLFWEREMNNRKRAHNDRTAGIAASTFPAVTAAPGQPEGPSGPQPPQFPLLNSADLFDEQDEEEEHRANRKAAKKGGKKGKNSKDKSPAAARSPPRRGRSSSFASERDDEEISISSKQSAGRRGKNKNRDDEDEYDEIEEEKTVSTKSKKKKGGKKSFVNEEEDDDIMPSFTSPASKTKGTKKTSKKSFVDDSDDDMPAAKPTKKKSAKKSILDDSDDDMPAVTKKSTKKKRTAA